MSYDEVKNIMSKYGHYDLAKTSYQRFKADSNRMNKADSTVEYLHILEKNNKYIGNHSMDLKVNFPNSKGFSIRNLKSMHKYYKICISNPIVQTASAKSP